MTRSAGQEGASCKARERRTGRAQTITGQVGATHADGPFLARPQAAHTALPYRVGAARRKALCLRNTALHGNAVLRSERIITSATSHQESVGLGRPSQGKAGFMHIVCAVKCGKLVI